MHQSCGLFPQDLLLIPPRVDEWILCCWEWVRDAMVTAWKIPLAIPQNVPQASQNENEQRHALSKSQDLQDVGASVILAIKFFLNYS